VTEYKTKLEEFTLEELKTIVDEAPVGWEGYRLETSFDKPIYLKYYLESVYIGNSLWEDNTSPWRDYRQMYFNKEDIEGVIKLLEERINE